MPNRIAHVGDFVVAGAFLTALTVCCPGHASASDRDLEVDIVTLRHVSSLYKEGSTLWIAGDEGLFRWDDTSKRRPERIDVDTGSAFSLYKDGSTLWIGSHNGLFRWDDTSKGQPERINVDVGGVGSLYKDGSTLWIGSYGGLFRWDDITTGRPERINVDVGGVSSLYKDGPIYARAAWRSCALANSSSGMTFCVASTSERRCSITVGEADWRIAQQAARFEYWQGGKKWWRTRNALPRVSRVIRISM
jgi:ligand-binding sensor domain-containing protein